MTTTDSTLTYYRKYLARHDLSHDRWRLCPYVRPQPVDMLLLHHAVLEHYHGAEGTTNCSIPSGEDGETSRPAVSNCTAALPLTTGQAFRRCEGLLCPIECDDARLGFRCS